METTPVAAAVAAPSSSSSAPPSAASASQIPAQSICLTSSFLCSLFPRETKKGYVRTLDLSKEFGSSDYPLLNFILRNVTEGIVSTVPASPASDPAAVHGLMYLFDGRCATYLQDGISWRVKKQAIKLIVYNDAARAKFKLKNQKGESGVPVMRRQTWQSTNGGWRRHEYRRILQEISYDQQPDGTVRTTEKSSLQNFPCIVHYFQKRAVIAAAVAAAAAGDDSMPEESPPRKSAQLKQKQQQRAEGTRKKRAAYSSSDTDTGTDTSGSDAPAPSDTLIAPTSPDIQLPPPLTSSPAPGSIAQAMSSSATELPPMDILRISSPSIGAAGTISLLPAAESPARDYVPVKSYAPDVAPCGERTRVLVVVDAFAGAGTCSCTFDGTIVPAREVANGCFEFFTPQRNTASIAFFWLSRMASQGADDPPVTTLATPFCLTPCDDRSHMTLTTNETLTPVIAAQMLTKFKHSIRELDLSHNNFTEVSFLEGFYLLTTLILDANKLDSVSKFPHLPKLRTLTLNSNRIENLEKFVDTLVACFPGLLYLSLLDNPACPFFLGQPHHYYNYRIYVISRMPQLTQLDSGPITPEERRHASSIRSAADEQEQIKITLAWPSVFRPPS